MSYASVLSYQAKDVFAFVKINRKTLVSGWTFDGVKWYVPWAQGPVVAIVMSSGPKSSDVSNVSISNFYIDLTLNRLYLLVAPSTVVYAEYQMSYATEEIPWYEIPTLDYTDFIKWNQGLLEIPQVRRTVSDNYSGFTPSEISPVVVAHAGADLWNSLYADSFVGCAISVWVCVGPIRPENCSKIFTGKILNVSFDDRKISFDLVENSDLIDGAYLGRFFSASDSNFRLLDPQMEGQPIPLAFGTPRWIRAVNTDYIKDGATTSDNRRWSVFETLNLASGTQSITLGTCVADGIGGFNVTGMTEAHVRLLNTGDRFQRTSDGVWGRMNFVLSSTSINISFAGTPALGNACVRPAIQEMFFQVPSKQGVVLNVGIHNSATLGWTNVADTDCLLLTSGFEAYATALGIATIDPEDFEVWVRVAGSLHNETFGGAYISPAGGAHEVTCLYWYLRKIVGLSENQINGASFIAAVAARTPFVAEFGGNSAFFTHPQWSSDFETHKDVIGRLLQQIGAIAYFDSEGLFVIKARSVMGSSLFEIQDADLSGSPNFEIRNDDTRGFLLDANTTIVGCTVTVTKTKPATNTTTVRTIGSTFGDQTTNIYGRARGLNRFDSVQLYDIGKDAFAGGSYLYRLGLQRIADYFSNRRLTVSFRAGGEILDVVPGNVVTLKREFIPGLPYVPGTLQTRKFFVIDVLRVGSLVEVTAEDQYAIEQIGSF